MESDLNISKDDVIAKIKDDGDFDKLRLKIIRKLKDNEELRDKIISVVKQSKALNRAGTENLKPRQLSDAIHEEVGNKIASQISDSLWEIIRSPDGMKNEIAETVQSVYDKMLNPKGKEVGESSFPFYVTPVQKEAHNNGSYTTSANENVESLETLYDSEPKEPPGFTLCGHNQNDCEEQTNEELQLPHKKSPTEKQKEEPQDSQDVLDPDNVQINVPPGFSSGMELKQPDHNDEDPDVPPGFG